ncbi:transcriptional regulator [Natrinema pallidum DSM 3751]|uniref:Transcriptional regulator n=2 Tax=Natrinema pallidum TaxID=69527 RepID=L9YRD1_9EURY|nr:transcriptional regulator [Natrinema pallidum DSM 3751]
MDAVDNGLHEKRELYETLDASRSTVDRAVRELESDDLLHRRNGECEFTRYGELAYQDFLKISETYKTLEPVADLLKILPRDADIDLNVVEQGDINLVNKRAKVAPLPAPTTTDCEHVHALLPALLPQQIDFFCRTATNDITVVIIITEELRQVLLEEHSNLLSTIQEAQIEIRTATELPRIAYTVIGSQKVWGWVYTDSGVLHGYFTNTTPQSIDYVDTLFEEYRSESQRWTDIT